MRMAINVYEYGRGGKCAFMFRYTYAGIKIIKIQIDRGDRYSNSVMRTSRAAWQRYLLNSQKKNTTNKNVVMNTEPKTNYAALATQLERQRRQYTHTTQTHRNRQTDKEWAWGRPRLLLAKRQDWEFTSGTSWVVSFLARSICTTNFSHPISVRRNRDLSRFLDLRLTDQL